MELELGQTSIPQALQIPAIDELASPPPTRKRYDFLDGLRGIAIIMVMMVHVAHVIPHLSKAMGHLAEYGGRGVQLFFIASGLTLAMNYKDRNFSKVSFFIKRYFRIFPMFYLAIVFYTIGGYFTGADYFAKAINFQSLFSAFLFLHGWTPWTIHSIVPGGWSIAAEMMFYVTLPLLLVFLKSGRNFSVIILASFALSFASQAILNRVFHQDAIKENFSGFFWLSQYPAFVLGCGIVLAIPVLQGRPYAARWLLPLSVIAILLTAYLSPSFRVADITLSLFALGAAITPLKILEGRFLTLLGRVHTASILFTLRSLICSAICGCSCALCGATM